MNEQITIQTDESTVSPESDEAASTQDDTRREPPHVEARKYRKRAQAAEQSLAEAQQALEEKARRLDELEATVNDLERRSRVDQLLIEADAIDLDAARVLTEVAVQQMDAPDVEAAVDELRRARPYLFRNGAAKPSAQGARIDRPSTTAQRAADAAAQASETGHRADLLRYLRLRRKNR